MDGVHWVATSKEPVFKPKELGHRDVFDLAVIGAGYCGLSVALQAAQAGLSTVVYEAGTVGCGASGRNGGVIVPHFPGARSPSFAEEQLGVARAQRLIEVVRGGAAYAFDRIRELGIECDAEQTGWVQPGHSQSTLEKVKSVYDDWAQRDADITWLDRSALNDRLGGCSYLGGWYAPSGGVVNPWALAQGLARAAEHNGANIKEHAPVRSIIPDGAYNRLRTDSEEITARKVVIATNGYTPNLAPRLGDTVIPVRLFHVLTRPLSENERRNILPRRTPFTDLRKSGGFCRLDVDNRVLSGGAVFAASHAPTYGRRHAARRMEELFPQLKSIEIEHYWEGWCALRENFLPVIQNHGNDVLSLIGFSTRGIALAQTLGREMGKFLCDDLPEAMLPVPVEPTSTISLRALKQFLGGWAFPVYQFRDKVGM